MRETLRAPQSILTPVYTTIELPGSKIYWAMAPYRKMAHATPLITAKDPNPNKGSLAEVITVLRAMRSKSTL
jgi:hypothetical protein